MFKCSNVQMLNDINIKVNLKLAQTLLTQFYNEFNSNDDFHTSYEHDAIDKWVCDKQGFYEYVVREC